MVFLHIYHIYIIYIYIYHIYIIYIYIIYIYKNITYKMISKSNAQGSPAATSAPPLLPALPTGRVLDAARGAAPGGSPFRGPGDERPWKDHGAMESWLVKDFQLEIYGNLWPNGTIWNYRSKSMSKSMFSIYTSLDFIKIFLDHKTS
jgi:hypothetical protein